ncbi:MAG: hypothetical protein ACJAYU_001156 [Bradymonadia bacterium]|jgi:hypothetical protein
MPTEETAELARPEAAWVTARVDDANERLAANRGGQIIAASIEAAGGLGRWYSNGPVQFRFRYVPIDRPGPDTVQTIDTWRSLAVHETTAAAVSRFGWDGENAWSDIPQGIELGTNPRFWSLTPYYFVGVPFVLSDPGVTLAYEGEIDLEGRTWELVRATFGDGVGDAPEDFYVVLVDQETHRIGGVRYVVSYPGFFPQGGHTPEKVLFYDGAQEIGGITLPETFRTLMWATAGEDGVEITGPTGDVVTNTYLTDVSFHPELPLSTFEIPEGATIQEGY